MLAPTSRKPRKEAGNPDDLSVAPLITRFPRNSHSQPRFRSAVELSPRYPNTNPDTQVSSRDSSELGALQHLRERSRTRSSGKCFVPVRAGSSCVQAARVTHQRQPRSSGETGEPRGSGVRGRRAKCDRIRYVRQRKRDTWRVIGTAATALPASRQNYDPVRFALAAGRDCITMRRIPGIAFTCPELLGGSQ